MNEPIEMTREELHRITRYRQPKRQLSVLRELGIPARLMPDNSVLVLRMHMTAQAALAEGRRPKLKSSR